MKHKNLKKLKLLISAYACDPNHGSEQGFAWRWVTNCSKSHDVTVLTCETQRHAIEKAISSSKLNIRFEYVKGPKKMSPSGVEYRFERLKAYIWQFRAISRVRRLIKNEKYNLAQHITIATWRQPSCLAFTKLPFIFGPVSGSEVLPPGFARHLGIRGFIWENIRCFLIFLAWYDPFVRFTLKRADKILIASPITYNHLKSKFPNKVDYYGHFLRFPELIQLKPLAHERDRESGYIQLAWMGQLIPRKGLDLLLKALSDTRLSNCILDIMGDGPERKRYTKLIRKLKIENRIRFLGYLERSLALKRLANCDIFVFTSLQDLMGLTLSEAMQLGLPCVVMDWSGPGALVGTNGAAKVKIANFDKTCSNLVEILYQLSCDPKLRRQLAENAIHRIMDLSDPVTLDNTRDQHFLYIANSK